MESSNTPPTTTGDSSQSESAQPESAASLPYGEALREVVRNLSDHPLLLFALGSTMLLIAAASIGLEQLRSVTFPLLIVIILGMVGWVFLEAQKVQRASSGASQIATGSINLKKSAQIQNLDAETGTVDAATSADRIQSGDISLGGTAERSSFKTGNVTAGKDNQSTNTD